MSAQGSEYPSSARPPHRELPSNGANPLRRTSDRIESWFFRFLILLLALVRRDDGDTPLIWRNCHQWLGGSEPPVALWATVSDRLSTLRGQVCHRIDQVLHRIELGTPTFRERPRSLERGTSGSHRSVPR